MKCNSYLTIEKESTGKVVVKKSTFLSFAIPVNNPEMAENRVKEFRKTYHDARHVCYSYVLSPNADIFRANDNGEPSGTAGRPILGVIRSAGLTNILIVVIRYFGGIKLGTVGLIAAYKDASKAALENAQIKTHIVEQSLSLEFNYPDINNVMHLLKRQSVKIRSSVIDSHCSIRIQVEQSRLDSILDQLRKLQVVKIIEKDDDAVENTKA